MNSSYYRHAFLIIAHNDWYCLERLIKMLDHKNNDIYIHIDKKVKDFDFNRFTPKYSKIIFVDREKVYWGDFSQVRVELKLFNIAYNSNRDYIYYHLLSGVDLPIKPMDYIHRFFADNKDKEFISFREDYVAYERTYRYLFFMKYEKHPNRFISILVSKLRYIIGNSIYKIGINRAKVFSKYKSGDNWVSITNAMVKLILDSRRYIYRAFKYTKCPDEVYKQTIIYGSHLCDNIYKADTPEEQSLRFTDWIRIYNNSSPHTLDISDLEMITKTSCLFARKFSSKNENTKKLIDTIYSEYN